MLPVRDDNPQVNVPYATYAILILNALAWVLFQGAGFGDQLDASVCNYGLIPSDVLGNSQYGDQRICPSSASSFSLISSMFMHGSWMHILGNMWFLWVFGDNVEDSMGSVRFAIFYILCGLAAAAAQMFMDVNSLIPMVGASGAIGGVMGAYILLYPRVKVHILVFIIIIKVPAVAMLGYWIGVQVIGGISSMSHTGGGVAFWAHIGGFVAGIALAMLFKDDELLLNHPYHGFKAPVDPMEIWNDPKNRDD